MEDRYAGVREDGGIEGYEPRFVDVDGLRTRYYEVGSGPPLVLAHGGNWGGLWSANTWTRTFDVLARAFRVLAFDRVGCGMTDNPAEPAAYRYGTELEHALDFLDAVGVETGHLVGFSRGAGLAARMAVEAPDRVRTLGLTNSATLGPAAGDGAFRHDRIFRMEAAGLEPTDPAYMRRLLEQYSYRTDYLTEERCRAAAFMRSREKARRTAAVMDDGELEPWLESLEAHMRETRRRIADGALSMPVLYAYGRNDLTVRFASAMGAVDLIGQTNPDVRLHLFSGCGHMIFLEHAEEFAQLLTDFIEFRS